MTSNSTMDSWTDMLYRAVAYQQSIYEVIPNWSVYNKKHIAYLKRNIGYALYGTPQLKKHMNFNNEMELNKLEDYGPTATALINKICTKICPDDQFDKNDNISVGIIYNMIFHSKTSTDCKMKKQDLIALPIFKILRLGENTKDTYTTCYIDTSARVYKNWEDYLSSNNLPQCTMVYPVGGRYQPNPKFDITSSLSYVWLQAQDSYACSSRAVNMSTANSVVSKVGIGASIGLGVMSLVNPVSLAVTVPVMAASAISNTWTIGKCSADLYDKSMHEESISPLNPDAMSAWLGITMCTVTLGVTASGLYLRNAAANGNTVKSFTKGLHNTLVVCNISVNLLGFGCHMYDMYKKYEENNINIQDVVHFGSSLLFFANNIISMRFADTIIETTQGQILKDFETKLCDDNMLKHYENVKNNAATDYSMDQTARNAAIVRYINTVDVNNMPSMFSSCFDFVSNTGIRFTGGKLQLNGITLIDPMFFVMDFATSYANHANQANNDWIANNPDLIQTLESLLSDLYSSGNYKSNQFFTIVDFKPLINSIKNIRFNRKNILYSIFNTALILLQSREQFTHLVETCCFVWNYVKKHLEDIQESGYDFFVRHVNCIIMALYDALDSMRSRFLNALEQYIKLTFNHIMPQSYL